MFDSSSFGFCSQQGNCADANEGDERNEEVRTRHTASSEQEGHDEGGQRTAEKPTDALKEANPGLAYAGRILLGAINLDHGIDADAEEGQHDPTRERQHGSVQQTEEDRSYGSSSCKADERGLHPEALNGKGGSVFAGNGGGDDDRGEQEGRGTGVALLQ